MKIKINDLSKMIKEELTGEGQQGRSAMRMEQAKKLVDATDLTNAEASLKVLARQTADPISPDQKAYMSRLTGRTSQETLKGILDKLYVDGLNGKPILGYMTMTPNKLKDIINSSKGLERLIAKDDEMAAAEAEEEETPEGVYDTAAQIGGDPFIDIGKKLGISTQRAKQLADKATERLKAGGSLAKIAAPAIREFIFKLADSASVTEFVMDVLKLKRATEADIELLVDLRETAKEDSQRAIEQLSTLFGESDASPLMQAIQNALRPEGAGRPSKVRTYFKEQVEEIAIDPVDEGELMSMIDDYASTAERHASMAMNRQRKLISASVKSLYAKIKELEERISGIESAGYV